MKYVMLRPLKPGTDFPVFCLAPQTHAMLASRFAGDARPIAAGFCEFYAADGAAKVRTFGFSNSLNLGPGRLDAALIEGFYNGTLAMNKEAVPA
jgi:hypothetical protein